MVLQHTNQQGVQEDQISNSDGHANAPLTLGRDEDSFTYRKTTTFQSANAGPVLLIGDLLDDLTYDNQFAVEQVHYYSAEEFIELLGLPFRMNASLAAALNNWWKSGVLQPIMPLDLPVKSGRGH